MVLDSFTVKQGLVVEGPGGIDTIETHERTMAALDPDNLLEVEDPNKISVTLIQFKTSKHNRWLTKSMGMKVSTWRAHARHLPILMEVSHEIQTMKKRNSARLPTNFNLIVPLKIRGHSLCFMNTNWPMTYALQSGKPECMENFVWFVREVFS